MAYTAEEWQRWQSHIDQKIAETGEWIGLVNKRLEPVCDFPPGTKLDYTHRKSSPGELTLTVPALAPNGKPHLVTDHLVDEGFGVQDETSRLVATSRESRFVVVQRAGGERARQCYQVVFPELSFSDYETRELTVNAVHVLNMLNEWPCPSVRAQWGHTPMRRWREDAGGKYPKAYTYAPIEMATVASGYVAHGPAESTIRDLIRLSLDAGYKVHPEWQGRHMIVNRAGSGESSPVVSIRLEDQMLWEAVENPAKITNVQVNVRLWWPGDAPVAATWWDPQQKATLSTNAWSGKPVLVCDVTQR